MKPSVTLVCRDGGQLMPVPSALLVPGDIVRLSGGDLIAADMRVLHSEDLAANNSSLTGENVEVKLTAEPSAEAVSMYEARNLARSGCSIARGTGTAVVFAIGDNTFFGSIATSTTATLRPETLMKHEVRRLVKFMTVVATALGVTFFILAIFHGYTWLEAVIFCIGIIVANVPEGLLPQMTVALTLIAQRMLRVGVLVTNLEVIETLGATTVICSDKTGTLTCNRMTVVHLVYDWAVSVTLDYFATITCLIYNS
jgi:sodium/potassium-transporting ATPase subunit alpha